MLLVPYGWFMRVPGVVETGPFNDHFVRDVGATYLACAVGLAWAALDPRRGTSGAVVAAAFLIVHAAIHVITPFCGTAPPWLLLARDFPGVFLPAILAGWIAFELCRKTWEEAA